MIRKAGMVHLRGAVGRESCEHALLSTMVAALQPDLGITAEVQQQEHRHNLRFYPEHPQLQPVSKRILEVVGAVLARMMSNEAKLVEMGAFLTNPGAKKQELHQDVTHHVDTPIYSVLLFLTDVEANGGRMEVVTGTHGLANTSGILAYLAYAQEGTIASGEDGSIHYPEYDPTFELIIRGWNDPAPVSRFVSAKAGDVVIYDSGLLHRGSANYSPDTQGVLYMSFMGQGPPVSGHTFGIHNDLLEPPRGPLSILDLQLMFGLPREEL